MKPETNYSHPLSEQIILVALNFHNEWLDDLADTLPQADLFAVPLHQDLYAAMQQLHRDGQAFDLCSVAITAQKSLHQTISLLDTLPPDLWLYAKLDREKVLTHAKLVAEAYVRRQVDEATRKGETADQLMQRVSGLQQRGADRLFNAEELALLAFKEAHEQPVRLPYPFALLQQVSSGGVRQDELVIVAGRPGTGKTAWMLQWAWFLASQGRRVLFASAEMSAQSLIKRISTQITGRNLMNPNSAEDRDALNQAIEQISASGLSILELTETAQLERHIRQTDRYDIVFVDYLQNLNSRAAAKGDYELVTTVTRELDAMSMKYGLPLVVASQFSRLAENQQPGMATLKSSGQIEQAADVIISLWAKNEEQTDPTRAKVYMDVLKNRNGYTIINGSKEYALLLNKPLFTFTDTETQRPEVYGHG